MGIRKVNLSDLKGSLSQRGRDRYENADLKEALLEAIVDGEAVIWDDAQVEGNNEKKRTASKMKWRNRAVSVFSTIETECTLTVRWTTEDECVLIVNQPNA